MRILTAGLDDVTIAFLEQDGHCVEDQEIEDMEDLEVWLEGDTYDTAILNIEKSGLGVYAARSLRKKGIITPLVCVAPDPEPNGQLWSEYRSIFLENGGDDLLMTPANPRELAASIRAASRRSNNVTHDIVELVLGKIKIKINPNTRSVLVNEKKVELTPKERAILIALASNPGKSFSKESIFAGIYSETEDEPDIKIIDVFVSKLRTKLKQAEPSAEKCIETVWGHGYRLNTGTEAG